MKETSYRRRRFQSRFTGADIELLAQADEAHETLSGPATKKILEREWQLYKQVEYERLADCRRLYRKTEAISSRHSASMPWTRSPMRTATPTRQALCKTPSGNYFRASVRSAGAHENRERRGNGEPWKSLLRFPHFHQAGDWFPTFPMLSENRILVQQVGLAAFDELARLLLSF